jgi:hypothetical protein
MNAKVTKFMNDLYEAARTAGWETYQCANLLKSAKIKWSDKEAVALIASEFRLGHIAGYLSLPSRDAAMEVMKLSGTERSELQQRAYRAAVSSWSNVRLLAGAPNARNGSTRAAPAKRAARTTTGANDNTVTARPTAAETVTSPKALAPVVAKVFPRVAAPDDVATFATWLVDTITAFEKRNAHVKMGDYRSAFHDFIMSVKVIEKQREAA